MDSDPTDILRAFGNSVNCFFSSLQSLTCELNELLSLSSKSIQLAFHCDPDPDMIRYRFANVATMCVSGSGLPDKMWIQTDPDPRRIGTQGGGRGSDSKWGFKNLPKRGFFDALSLCVSNI